MSIHPKNELNPLAIPTIQLGAQGFLDNLLSRANLLRPVQEFNFWQPTPSGLLALGLRSHTDIPALKELEEWFDSQKRNSGKRSPDWLHWSDLR
jgi:hypothetical protein